MTVTQKNLFPYGDYLNSSQLHMEPDEVDTLREGEDPGTQGDGSQTGEVRDLRPPEIFTSLGFFFFFLSPSQLIECIPFWTSMTFSL